VTSALVGVLLLSVATLVASAVAVWWRREAIGLRMRIAQLEAERMTLIHVLEDEGLPVPAERPRTLRVARQAARAFLGTAEMLRAGGFQQVLNASLDEFGRWLDTDRTEIEQWATEDGLVTVVFSDIEGSTAINEAVGDDAWLRILRAHDNLIRAEVERCGGHIVKSQGDGYMIVFGQPLPAVKAAIGIQRRLARGRNRLLRRAGIRVRMGMHTGQVVSRDGDYFGRNVALAARVAAQADGAEILVTEEVRAIVSGIAPAAVRFEADHVVELKGFTDQFQLWRVRWI
jgi:class 3 adenylate cyclase